MGKKGKNARKNKRQQFVGADKAKKGGSRSMWIGAAVIAGIAIVAAIVVLSPGTQTANTGGTGGGNIEMTDIKATVAGNQISVPIDAVKKDKFVYFEYTGGAKPVPLLAYVGPSGKIIAAVSMCEPCKSTRFHIEGDELVCNTCGTRWELETHEGISGGCPEYPPDILTAKTEGGNLVIPVDSVANWKPRV